MNDTYRKLSSAEINGLLLQKYYEHWKENKVQAYQCTENDFLEYRILTREINKSNNALEAAGYVTLTINCPPDCPFTAGANITVRGRCYIENKPEPIREKAPSWPSLAIILPTK